METHAWPAEMPDGHILQLFDNTDSAADAVSLFLEQALGEGGVAVAVMAPAQWARTAELLLDRGMDAGAAMRDGRLSVCDSRALLESLTRHGVPDPVSFEHIVGPLLRRAQGRSPRLSVYGDMVNRLAERGDFRAARALEACWNRLRARHPLTLFCGYSSVHFGDPRSADALRRICDCHSQVRSTPTDILGDYLLARYRGDIPQAIQTH